MITLVDSGISQLGKVLWGTHTCLFYEQKEDLLEILVPYFKAGLENNESCVWVTSGLLGNEEAKEALAGAVPELATGTCGGEIEFFTFEEWYLEGGRLDQQAVLAKWAEREEGALARGVSGLPVSGHPFWKEIEDWGGFIEYERMIDSIIGSTRMLALCTYQLRECETAEVFEVIEVHDAAIARRNGDWSLVVSGRRKSENQLQSIMEHASAVIYIVDEDDRLCFVNRRWESRFRMGDEEVYGRSIRDIFPEEIADQLVHSNREVFRTGRDVEFEEVVPHDDGASTYLTQKFLLSKPGESPALLCGICTDITSHKQAEEALTVAQRMESLGILAGGIAHDFNNLLSGIFGNLSVAIMDAEEGSDLREMISESMRACHSASGLTKQLLTFAKGGSPTTDVVALDSIVRESCIFATRGSAVKCVFAVDDGLLPARVDEDQLAQVLRNLVINACQAMPAGGVVTITAANLELDETCGLPLEPGPYLAISLRDEGDGISEDKLSRVFEPYFSTKAVGRGLGLAICHSIVTQHGGHIGVESNLGEGATFTIYLPAADPAALSTKAGPGALETGVGRVLVMDDEPKVATALTRMLRRLGYECETVSDGASALQAWKNAMASDHPFDVAIMDLTIPAGMGGKEANEKLKELDPDAKAIVSSGYSEDPIIAQYEKFGFLGVLAKPYGIGQAAEVLSRVLNDRTSK